MNQEKKAPTGDKFDIDWVEKKYEFSQKERKAQRFAAVIMLLFLTAGLLGFFGGGMVSQRKVSADAFNLEYHHYLRENSPSQLTVQVNNTADTTVISFNKKYLEKVRVDGITPQPKSTKTDHGRVFYTFNTAPEGLIVFYLIPDDPGELKLKLGIQGEIKLINQFVHY